MPKSGSLRELFVLGSLESRLRTQKPRTNEHVATSGIQNVDVLVRNMMGLVPLLSYDVVRYTEKIPNIVMQRGDAAPFSTNALICSFLVPLQVSSIASLLVHCTGHRNGMLTPTCNLCRSPPAECFSCLHYPFSKSPSNYLILYAYKQTMQIPAATTASPCLMSSVCFTP